MESVERLFSVEDLASLLEKAASRLLHSAKTRSCEGLTACRTVYVGAGSDELLDAQGVAQLLVRPDGWHRPDVRIGPVATLDDALVVEFSWPIGNEWTNRILTGPQAFPEEPFILVGPALPAGWRQGQPIPKVRLPAWEEYRKKLR